MAPARGNPHRHDRSAQRQSRLSRRFPQLAQREDARKVTIPLAAPARTISHAAAVVEIAAIASHRSSGASRRRPLVGKGMPEDIERIRGGCVDPSHAAAPAVRNRHPELP
jgi:hypothetical protein